MNNTVIVALTASMAIFITGCVKQSDTDIAAPDVPINDRTNYPAIDLPFADLASRIVNDESGLGENTVWYCYEPETGDIIDPVAVTFNSDGTGTFAEWAQSEPTTWTLTENDLIIKSESGTRTYSDISMPITSVIDATILGAEETGTRLMRAMAISDGTGPFSCQGALNTGLYADLVPLKNEELVNGQTNANTTGTWRCDAPVGVGISKAYTFAVALDGGGEVSFGLGDSMPISFWRLENRDLIITASDGRNLEINIQLHKGEQLYVATVIDGEGIGRSNCNLVASIE